MKGKEKMNLLQRHHLEVFNVGEITLSTMHISNNQNPKKNKCGEDNMKFEDSTYQKGRMEN